MTSPAEPAPTDNDSARATESQGASLGSGASCGESVVPVPCQRSDQESAGVPRWGEPGLRICEPGEFIAAVPALLGFVPQRSLVVCMLQQVPERPGSVRLGAVARHDLDLSGCAAWVPLAGQLASICRQEHAVGVLVLIVDERGGIPRPGRPGARAARHLQLLHVLAAALRTEQIELSDAWAVREIGTGALWWSLLVPDEFGLQLDPDASPVTLAHVLDGRPIRSSRAELSEIVAIDPRARAEVAAEVERAVVAARQRLRAQCGGEASCYSRAALEMVLWQVTNTASGALLDPREIADLAVALRDSTVRDALFALAVSDHAEAAEVLWARLCRALTGADRAEAATLLAYSAYTRGDGPFAGIALEAALEADPEHTLARLLETALCTGVRPQEVRALARSGRDKAAGLGVELAVDSARFEP
jgi:hypothetical protein